MVTLLLACSTPEPPPPPPFTPEVTEPGWWSGEALPWPRQEHGVVSLDGQVVVVGGVDDGPQIQDAVQAFDPVEGTWSDLPPLPRGVHHPNVVVVDGDILVLGALDAAFRPIAEAGWRLASGAGSWSDVTPPPRPVGSSAIGWIGGEVHVVGGLGAPGAVAWHQVWDPSTDTWSDRDDAPHARDHLAFGVIDEQLIVTGGRQRSLSAFVAATDRYDPVDDTWQSLAAIPTPRGGVAAAVLGGRLHVLGGEGSDDYPDGVFPTHEAYDPVADEWQQLGDLPAPRHGMGAAVVDEVLWVPGGAPIDGFGAEDVNQGFIE